MVESVMEQINKVANEAIKPVGGKYLYCPLCTCYAPWNPATPAPTVCPKCGKETGFGLGNDLPSAKRAWADRVACYNPNTLATVLQKTAEKLFPAAPPAPPVAPAPTVRRRAAPKKTTVETPPVEQPPATTQAEATPEMTARELRRQAIDRLVVAKDLNNIAFRSVCKAKIYTRGFTIWQDKVPQYCFMEDIDSADSFRKVLDEARKEYGGNVALDVALLTGIDDDLVCACLFRGQLVASTFSSRGPISCTRGAKVSVGAMVAKSGNLIFSVMEVL